MFITFAPPSRYKQSYFSFEIFQTPAPKMASASGVSTTDLDERQILVLAEQASNGQSLCETGNHVEGYQLSAKTYTTLKTIGNASTSAYTGAVDAFKASMPSKDQENGLVAYNTKSGVLASLTVQYANVQAGNCPLQKNKANPCIGGSRCKSTTLRHGVTVERKWKNPEKASNMWIDQNVVFKSSSDVAAFCTTVSNASATAITTKKAGDFDVFSDHVLYFAEILVFQLKSIQELSKATKRNCETNKLGGRTVLREMQDDIDALKVKLHNALPHIEEYEHKPYAGSKK